MNDDLSYVIDVARGAGRIILEHYGKTRRLTKTHAAADAEAVTDADRSSQRFIVEGLRKRFPADGIIGEENETGDAITNVDPSRGARVWVIDPLDGTNNFCAGLGNFAVSIGLLEEGRPVLGVVLDVTRDQVYAAAHGQGAWCGPRRLTANPTPLSPSSVILLTSSLCEPDGRLPAYPVRWLTHTNWKLRILGSAAIEASLVAAGVAHAAVTVQGKLWDIAAGAALLAEAGAVLTDLKGRPIFPYACVGYRGAKVPFLAAGPEAHAQLLADIMRP